MKSIFEETGGTYTEVGDVLLPDLEPSTTDAACLGRWGRMRKRYLKEHRPVLYTNLLLSEKLYRHCAEVECACEDRLLLYQMKCSFLEIVTGLIEDAEGKKE